MEGGQKVALHCFLADQKITKKMCLGHPNPIARATSYCLLPDTL